MKRVAKHEHQLIVEIPPIVGVDPIRVEPPLAVVVPLDVKHVRVAVGVRCMHDVAQSTAHRVLSGLYRIRHHNAVAPRTKYLLFFKLASTTLSPTAVKETLDAWLLDSAAGNPCRPHTRLLPLLVYKNGPSVSTGAGGQSSKAQEPELNPKRYLRSTNTNS